MTSAASALSAPSSTAAASNTSDYELLQLLEEFSADDITDVVSAIDADACELLQSSSSSTGSTVFSATDANGMASSLEVVNGPVLPVDHHQHQHITSNNKNNNKKKPSAAVEPLKAKPVRRNDPNKARNGRKEELIYLHKKIAELETQFGAMKRSAPPTDIVSTHQTVVNAATATTQASASDLSLVIPSRRRVAVKTRSSTSTAASAAAARVWEELAERQRDLRVQSERENIRLKLVLETQLKIAKSLEKILLKPTSTRVRTTEMLACTCIIRARKPQQLITRALL